MFGWGKGKQETFQPVKKVRKEDRNYRLQEISKKTNELGDLKEAVKLPPGEDLDEWLALNVGEFYDQISCLYASISDKCTPQTCPKMTAGPQYQYFWQDNVNYKKPTQLPAPEYIANVMSWANAYISNDKYFPTDPSAQRPPDFRAVIANIFKRLFRIYAHIYHHHRKDITQMGAETNLDTSFKHFYYFCTEFNLIPADQMKPLEQITKSF